MLCCRQSSHVQKCGCLCLEHMKLIHKERSCWRHYAPWNAALALFHTVPCAHLNIFITDHEIECVLAFINKHSTSTALTCKCCTTLTFLWCNLYKVLICGHTLYKKCSNKAFVKKKNEKQLSFTCVIHGVSIVIEHYHCWICWGWLTLITVVAVFFRLRGMFFKASYR